ncbi:MAG: hypothetical protein FD145_882 [Candidatus Saganbacteria bacterium]|uniref:DNA 3'-5' helicase n=1 Tax=Candidatus Saganbacteria bacterium TaxID=2575572 RepID=A0A833L113_UNCSA|nr:MAG: hypothetical protein FD145_882 [Candidatus Saganbacteria bacterium]
MLNKSTEEILAGLNPEQKDAVVHGKGPLLIVAGAGTGKTTVITKRIAYLIAQKLAKPSEILALTFTDKAANEMENRVDLLVPYGYVDVSISTFHAFGDKVLRDYAIDLGMRPDYRVLSFAEQMVFFREHWHEFPLKHYLSLSDPTKHAAALLKVISRAKDEDISPEEYLKIKKSDFAEVDEYEKQIETAKVFQKYQELMGQKGFVDFGDQGGLVLKLFRGKPSVLKKYINQYKFILVDEFQDTNYAQYQLLKLLAGRAKNITVVGDDDQAIFKFRGASITNILNFTKDFKRAKKIVLSRNYRSTQLLLDSAYKLIKNNNPERLEIKENINKQLVAEKGAGENKVVHKHFDSYLSEADWAANTIKKKYDLGGHKYGDFAILVRANADAEPFQKSLNMAGIPYFYSGGGGLYNAPEIMLVSSFLRAIGDLTDNVSLYNLAASEIYRMDPLDMQKINSYARRRNHTIHHVFSNIEKIEPEILDLKEASKAVVIKIMEDINYYLDFAKNHTTGEVLYQFLKKSGYLTLLTSDEKNEQRLKNIAAFFDRVREFKGIADVDRVSEFVKYFNLYKEAGENPESSQPDIESDAVNILTIHKAKGLEFKVVFMPALVADKFPSRTRRQQIDLPPKLIKEYLPPDDHHLGEERRLFYVGMTRAKEELYFTSAYDYGGKRQRKVSQFVLEAIDLPKADIETIKRNPADQIELFAPYEVQQLPRKIIKPDEIIHLSYYPIGDYLICPLKYKYAHELKLPLLPSHAIMFGSALHKAVQAYYSAKLNGNKFTKKDLLDMFLKNWSSEGFISTGHEEMRQKEGLSALSRFYEAEKKSKKKVKYVEEEFTFVKDKIQIKGRWDIVMEDNGKIYIIDFKSTEVKDQEKADKKAKDSIQLAIYALAWLEMFGNIPDYLQLDFISAGIAGSAQKQKADIDKTWEKIKTVAESIRAGDFHATPGSIQCGYCAYGEICPKAAV